MKKTFLIILLLILFSCITVALTDEEYMKEHLNVVGSPKKVGPMNFVFSLDEEENLQLIESHRSEWGTSAGTINGIYYYMYHLLSREEFIQLMLDSFLKLPYCSNQNEKVEVHLFSTSEFEEGELSPILIEYLNSSSAKERYSQEERKKLLSIIMTSDFSEPYSTIKMKTSPRNADYFPITLFIVDQGMKCLLELKNKEMRMTEEFKLLALCLTASAYRYYIRSRVEPSLFSQEEKKILFSPLKNCTKIDLDFLASTCFNTWLSALKKGVYEVPSSWQACIRTWEWDNFVKELQDELNELFHNE